MAGVDDLPELTVTSATAWRSWLRSHGAKSAGVWLVLAKRGTSVPTSLSYEEALDESLCHGWIDGLRRSRDGATFIQRFTPRRPQSAWSKRNVDRVARLTEEGRMRPAGVAEVERAKQDGRWNAAYLGQAAIGVPDDLAAALATDPKAAAMFETLNSQNRYAVLYRIDRIKRADTRAAKIEQFVAMLARGETIHPQGGRRASPPGVQ